MPPEAVVAGAGRLMRCLPRQRGVRLALKGSARHPVTLDIPPGDQTGTACHFAATAGIRPPVPTEKERP